MRSTLHASAAQQGPALDYTDGLLPLFPFHALLPQSTPANMRAARLAACMQLRPCRLSEACRTTSAGVVCRSPG